MAADQKKNFIATYGPIAQDISEKTGLDPSLVLGQMAQETGWGQHVYGNNVFGISPHHTVAAYSSVPEAAQAYVDLINNRYSNATQKQGVSSQAEAISAGGYGPNNSYGRSIANMADQVKQAGYSPSNKNNNNNDDADIETGRQLFQQITGQEAPPIPTSNEHLSNSIDVSSDPMVDKGKEIFKSVTGIDPDADVSESKTQSKTDTSSTTPASTTGGSSDSTATGTPDTPANNTPVSSLVSGVGSLANNATGAATNQLSGLGPNLMAGIKRGVQDVGDTIGTGITKGVQYMDQKYPMLNALDNNYGVNIAKNGDANIARAQAAKDAYDQQYGNSLAANVGRLGGNLLGTAPVLGPIGRAGLAAGDAAAGTVSSPILQGAIQGAAQVGTGAAQGALGAAATGGDIKQGAELGGALPLAGNALAAGVKATAPVMSGIGAMANTKIGDSLVKLATRGIGFHYGDIAGMLLGGSAGDVLKDIATRYGPAVANKVAGGIAAATKEGVALGAPGLAGAQAQPNNGLQPGQ